MPYRRRYGRFRRRRRRTTKPKNATARAVHRAKYRKGARAQSKQIRTIGKALGVVQKNLQCCVDDRRMILPTTRRAMVDLRQMLCVYLAKAEGCRNKYKKWWCTSAELENTPKAVRERNEKKNRETDEFIKQYLDSD